jgi:hypothetical protein
VKVTIVAIIVATATLSSCGARQDAAHAAGAFLDCEAPTIAAALSDLVPLGVALLKARISGDGTVDTAGLRADLAAIRSDLGRCAIAAAAVALSSVVNRTVMESSARAHASMAEEFTAVRGELAWPRVRVAGTVL